MAEHDTRKDSLSGREAEMKDAFWQRAGEILNNTDAFKKGGEKIVMGMELELSALDSELNPITQTTRDDIIRGEDFLDVELGAAQIELRTSPIDIMSHGISALNQELVERVEVLAARARGRSTKILLHGTNPFAKIKEIVRTDKPKYQIVPDFHEERRRPGVNTIIGKEPVDIGNAAVVSLTNACHLNLQTYGVDDAVDKLNRSISIAPLSIALGGNSRFFEESDTGIQDSRLIAWEISHDTRTREQVEQGLPTRVGLPKNYIASLEDYFKQVASYPFILFDPDHALEIGIGLFWKDARIKFYGNSCVVEFRPLSTQPTAIENVQLQTFFLGRLLWSQRRNEIILPFNLVKQNRLDAMINGTCGRLWTDNGLGNILQVNTKEVLSREVQRAKEGLSETDLPNTEWNLALLDELKQRIERGNPSEQMARELSGERNSPERKSSLSEALCKRGLFE